MSDTSLAAPHFAFDNLLPIAYDRSALSSDLRRGLAKGAGMKETQPLAFYANQQGNDLYDQITINCPEYYPTRCERRIFTDHAAEFAAMTGARSLIVLGAGTSAKTRVLLDAFGTQLEVYVPVDIAEDVLRTSATALAAEYPNLRIHALRTDYLTTLELPADAPGPRALMLPGGNLGNYHRGARARLLNILAGAMQEGDTLTLGIDLVKDPATLVAAYDDPAGLSAAFNLNILRVYNELFGADFDPSDFRHIAHWDRVEQRIEMRLQAVHRVTVAIPALGMSVEFEEGEHWRTEISQKWTPASLGRELTAAGLRPKEWWTDDKGRYAVATAVPASRPATAGAH